MKTNEYYEKAADVNEHLHFSERVFEDTGGAPMMPHFHDSVEFIFVKEGKYLVNAGSAQRVLKAGEAAFIDSFVPHYYAAKKKATVYAVVIEKKLCRGDLFSTRVFETFPKISEQDFSTIIGFFDSIKGYVFANKQTKAGFANMLIGLLLVYCDTFERKENKTARTFTEVIRYLNDHFKEDVTLKSLAKRFSYAENYFSALFNDFTGMSLREYVNRKRIAEVLRIKSENPNRSLFSVAETCGYTNEKTFYRAYAKYKN